MLKKVIVRITRLFNSQQVAQIIKMGLRAAPHGEFRWR
jgi:hypothetical protein